MSITTAEKARETLINSLSLDRAAVAERNNEVHKLLKQGFNGYANMSNEELVECASDAGLGDNDDPEDAQAMRVLEGLDDDDEVLVCQSLNHLVPARGGDRGMHPALRIEPKDITVPKLLGNQQMPTTLRVEPVLKVVQDTFGGDPHREYPQHKVLVTLFNGQIEPSAEFRFESLQTLGLMLDSREGVAAILSWTAKSLDSALAHAVIGEYAEPGEAADSDLFDLDDIDGWADAVIQDFGAEMWIDFSDNPY